jgi:murein DD-endopeptidase MepM/ murein hydrolase activator NlpD
VFAIVVAAGIGLVWPGDLHLVTTPRNGAAAEEGSPTPTAAVIAALPSAALEASIPVITEPPTPTVPATSAPPTAAPVAMSAPSDAAAASSAPSSTPVPLAAPSSAPAPLLTSITTPASDLARIRAQTWEPPTDPSLLDGYEWPLPKGIITDPFGPSPWGSHLVDGQLFHDGLDIATVCGDKVVAAHSGTVLVASRHFDGFIGWVGDLGPYFARLNKLHLWNELPITIVIDDGNGYRSIYAHFGSVVVKPGQHVQAGQLVGYEGMTGRATGCHLHYGLFSPHETATMAMEPSVVKTMLAPKAQIARIDPLRVLPIRKGDATPIILGGTAPTGHDLGGG